MIIQSSPEITEMTLVSQAYFSFQVYKWLSAPVGLSPGRTGVDRQNIWA
jgi:hypothetical protein